MLNFKCIQRPSFLVLKKIALKHNKKADLRLLKKAFNFSKKAHRKQKRASGKPYFVHPFNTACFLARYGLDSEIIATGLLHDVLEDTQITKKELRKEFGSGITGLVESLTKLNLLVKKSRQEKRTKNLQKMLFATTKDLRVVLVKLADKLHNIHTLRFLPKAKQVELARDTMELYAPLARKLGITDVEIDLEEICFPLIYPEVFKKFNKKIITGRKRKEKEITPLIRELKKKAKEERIPLEAKIMKKTHHLLFQKMTKKLKSFDELNDFAVLGLVTNSVENCYQLLGLLHSMYSPIPQKMKDYIAIPRSEFYQAIHSTVIGPNGNPIKIYIRTKKMDELFHYGAIMMLKKEKKGKPVEKKIKLLGKILSLDENNITGTDFIKALKSDFLTERIFVFSIGGAILDLPAGSTAVDFAFSLSSEIGSRMLGAKVNGKVSPIWRPLKSGDIVEIIRKRKKTVSKDWVHYVKTHKAREEILKETKGKRNTGSHKHVVRFHVVSGDRLGLLRDYAKSFTECGINILTVDLDVDYSKEISTSVFAVEVDSQEQMKKAVKKLKNLPEILKVETAFLG